MSSVAAVEAWSTFALAILALIAAWYARGQVGEARAIRKAAGRAYVVIDAEATSQLGRLTSSWQTPGNHTPKTSRFGSNLPLRQPQPPSTMSRPRPCGRVSDCDGTILDRPRWEVVYAATRSPVSFSDLKQYVDEGPDALPEFHVFAITERVFLRDLQLAKRKAYSIGIELFWQSLFEHEISTPVPELVVPDTNASIPALFERLGRTGQGDDLCEVPAAAVFRYRTDKRLGYTSVFRSPMFTGASGGSLRDRLPEFFFRYVLIHELGHYFGLDHPGHDGAHNIMWTPAEDANLDTVTSATVAELFLSGMEPQFTRDDASRVWSRITSTAIACLDDSDVVIT